MPLSRKYRPQLFSDVTGQGHITETLRKEVLTGSLGHSYLFSGPRGVGKTTTARIFAKALLNESNDHGEPILDSEASIQVDNGNCIDFLEIDAASHTGVDHVREVIIEHVRFAPARWKRKVYVIDECHMLSTSAWNALLKTLEEPPDYAFFILATTELHKVPETIKSRCQRFEFKRITSDDLAVRIFDLAKKENIQIDDSVVRQIVHASDGCLRDAESLLEQLMSLGEAKITSDIASLVLPVSMLTSISKLFELAIERRVEDSIVMAKTMIEEGVSPFEILQNLLEISRMLIRAQDSEVRDRFSKGDEGDRAIAQLFDRCSLNELSEIALMLLERRRDVKMGTDPLFALELSICAIAGGLLPHAEKSDTHHVEPRRASPPVFQEPAPQEEKKLQTKTNRSEVIYEKTVAVKEVSDERVSYSEKGDVHLADDPIENSQNEEKEVVENYVVKDVPERASYGVGLEFDIHDVRKYWSVIIREVETINHSLPFILKVCQPDHLIDSTIHIRFQYPFHREKLLEDIKTKRVVEEAIRKILKNDSILIDGFCGSGSEQDEKSLKNAPMDVVSQVLGAFGGTVIE